MHLVLLLALALLPQAVEIAPLLETAQAAYLTGDYERARQTLLQAWDLAQQRPAEDPVRYEVLKRLTSVRAAAGEFRDADGFLQLAINWRETVIGQADPKITDDLIVSASLCRGMKDYSRALAILGRVAVSHRQAFGLESLPIADDSSRMAQIYMEMKNIPGAISMLNSSLQIRSKLSGPLDPTLVPDLDRLAGAHIVLREYQKAEAAYRRVLVIRETLLGKDDADLIATVDGLAYSCLGQKKYEEAEPIYRRLIDLWVKSVGEDHPMVAVAYDKVAMFYLQQGKHEQAHAAKDRSVAIRAFFLAAGLSTSATARIAAGKKDEALEIYQRAVAVLAPPDSLYDAVRAELEAIVKSMETPLAAQPAPRKAPAKKK
jgi:tetratricopeptide (TPR) repeat protein